MQYDYASRPKLNNKRQHKGLRTAIDGNGIFCIAIESTRVEHHFENRNVLNGIDEREVKDFGKLIFRQCI